MRMGIRDRERPDPTQRAAGPDIESAGAQHQARWAPTHRPPGARRSPTLFVSAGGPLAALFVTGPGALCAFCVGARRFVSGPGAPCVGARRSLCRNPPLCVASRRRNPAVLSQDSLCQRRSVCCFCALFVSGPGALCVGARRSLRRGPTPLCRGPPLSVGDVRRGPAVLSQDSLCQVPAVSSPKTLLVRSRQSVCWAPLFVGARRSLGRCPAVCVSRPNNLCVSGPGALCLGPGALGAGLCRGPALFVSGPVPHIRSRHIPPIRLRASIASHLSGYKASRTAPSSMRVPPSRPRAIRHCATPAPTPSCAERRGSRRQNPPMTIRLSSPRQAGIPGQDLPGMAVEVPGEQGHATALSPWKTKLDPSWRSLLSAANPNDL